MPEHDPLAVRTAREAAAEELAERLRRVYDDAQGRGREVRRVRGGLTSSITVDTLATIPTKEKDWAWQLFERNMRTLYEASSEGYDAQEKRTELFDAESRFLTLRQDTGPPLGYCIFRFDTEETAADDEDEDDLCDVAYCYELQIEPGAQRQGAGRILMDALERLAEAFNMDKTMLTAFKHNPDALAFYSRIGFETDEVDPSQYGIEDVDYVIMSKPCK